MKIEETIANMTQHFKQPTDLEIGEYALGLLPADRAREVAHYLERHPHATRLADGLQTFWDNLRPEKRPPATSSAKVNILIAQLLATQDWQAAGVRGESSGVYQVGSVQVTVAIDGDLDDPSVYVLTGIITGGPLAAAHVTLWSADHPEATGRTTCDEDGHFMLSGIRPGSYELIIHSQETAVHIPQLQIRDS